MLQNSILIKIVFIAIFSIFFISCQTSKPLPSGIQTGYEAVNPASIIAVPLFILPDPSKTISIDLATISSENIIALLQKKVIDSFDGQPNINGYPFEVVQKALLKSNSNVLLKLNETMKNVANRFSSRDSSVRTLITSSCLSRRNFLEFYSYCLATEPTWIDNLNTLTARVMNADTALILVINQIESHFVDGIYSITGGFSVLLVDTNNAKLVWGKDGNLTLQNPPEKKYFPYWSDLINGVFTNNFWDDFPGRVVDKKIKKK
ncbi:hypothetical protein [Fluviispira sanaruensis]|uniref:Uncharacterized protein n=1 Tax=Fluviispira sanaruensis TaxID=2493639 RepID=A0A4P2VM73_FLUSA|nr:hypothetical protein [Fluviispira sanaruensis]BBH54466.1 hypothetical protein JCM31447_29370 [Fluviispira sanaruensis]